MHLDLETSRGPASTSFLELASLGLNVWFLVLVWAHSKMLECFSRILWSSQEKGVASSWGTESQLIQGQNLTTRRNDTGTSGCGETKSGDTELWDSEEAVIIGDGADDYDGLVIGFLRRVGDNSGQGNGWSVDTGHEQTTENDLVERRVGTASQEAV